MMGWILLPKYERTDRVSQRGEGKESTSHIYHSLFAIFDDSCKVLFLWRRVGLLNRQEGATRALLWKCVLPHLVAGGALWRAHRHLEQSAHGPVSGNTDHRKCSFLQGFIRVLAVPFGTAKMLIYQWFLMVFSLENHQNHWYFQSFCAGCGKSLQFKFKNLFHFPGNQRILGAIHPETFFGKLENIKSATVSENTYF